MVKVSARMGSGQKPATVLVVPRLLAILLLFCFLGLAPQAARAQNALQGTQIMIGAPAQADLGTPITVQALLTDSQGHPLSKEVVYFTVQESFLHKSSDEVLAQATTNGSGQAVATFADDFSGSITLNAEFKGDQEYAPSSASTPLIADGQQQVYAEHVGVDVPGLNVPPLSRSMAAIQSPLAPVWDFIGGLWPAMNGWPLAAALLLVWANYFLAVTFVFRVAGLGRNPDEGSVDPRRSQ